MGTHANIGSGIPTTRFPSHQLSSGLIVSGHPDQYREKQNVMTSTATPYTGGDIKKSGELGKMFDIRVEDPVTKKSVSLTGDHSKLSSHSGPLLSSGVPSSAYSASGPKGPPQQNLAFEVSNRSWQQPPGGTLTRVSQTSHSGPLPTEGGEIASIGDAKRSITNTPKNSGPLSGGGGPEVAAQNSGNMLPVTGLITSGPISSGPLNSSGFPSRGSSGSLDSSGAPMLKPATGSASHVINKLSSEVPALDNKVLRLILWITIPLFIVGFIAGGFILVTVQNSIVLIVVASLSVMVLFALIWNSCWRYKSTATFLASYKDSNLKNAKEGQYVKVTGVVTCGSVPLESSYQRVGRCIYTSTGVYEYRGFKSKAAKRHHRYFSWGLRYMERHAVDFYISDFQSGLRALVKAGYGAAVIPYVEESTIVDVNAKNNELPDRFVRWLGERNLSCDDRIMRLKEAYIEEGITVTVMGVVQQHENILMIVPSRGPVSTGCKCPTLTLPRNLEGLIILRNETYRVDAIPV